MTAVGAIAAAAPGSADRLPGTQNSGARSKDPGRSQEQPFDSTRQEMHRQETPREKDAASILSFSEVPKELSNLSLNVRTPRAVRSLSSLKNADNRSSNPAEAATVPILGSGRQTALSNPPHHHNITSTSEYKRHDALSPSPSAPSSDAQPTSAIRRTSPGLAARLKALGFGSSTKPSASPTTPLPDRIGRLDEHQLRQLDEKHQAGSLSSIIARRGRPWKGAGARPGSAKSGADEFDDERGQESDCATDDKPKLPEIKTTEPLAMDTQKYRLPDHTNGNGTKATLDTRREHLERDPVSLNPDTVTTPPPPPPPKDTPTESVETPPTATSSSNDYVPGLGSYFTPGHNRPGSIYTLSRASFANQLAQLTSLQLPDAESLSSKVSAIPTAQVAAKALINAADQIRSWISKASEVIEGLDSEDDVEWAAAGGREGLAEVENAISRFEELINVYVSAIEELQGRPDITDVNTDDLTRAVTQMEGILDDWSKIRNTLHNVRAQVEIAMEWEELWNNVLGDIQGEMDELARLVFEMEERRHKGIAAAATGDNVDIGDLETIVEEKPPQAKVQAQPNRFSLPAFPLTPGSPGTPGLSQDDSSLLALFARMQPLRASLDFLPMRLSVFETRAERSFPTACEELDMRRNGLDASYKKLEKDAESLRKELGEDRWVIVFRGAGRQAQKMHESVERSLLKVKESIDGGMHLINQPTMLKKMESYEAKKTHYGPAIERVLSIIDKGVKDRLTVNGEILRLHADLQHKWDSLKQQFREMDVILEEMHSDTSNQQLRDSISSMLSNDQSTIASGNETPGSSPPSSVIMSSLGFDPHTPSAKAGKTPSSAGATSSANRRHSSLPTPSGPTARKTLGSRLSTIPSSSANTPVPQSKVPRPGSTIPTRPRWNGSTNTSGIDTGHNFKPLSVTTPSPYSKRATPNTQRSASSLTPSSVRSKLPSIRNPAARASSEPPEMEESPSRRSHSRLASFRDRLASPGPYAQQTLMKSRLSTQSSNASQASNRRASLQPAKSNATEESQTSRPASSLASSRRSSILPQPKAQRDSSTGRSSPFPKSASRLGMRKNSTSTTKDSRPAWRP